MAKRTKIVCTLGPSVDSESTLKGLINAGMDIARFNFSHGSHDEQRARMDRLRKVRREMDSPCAILLDTKGPEIRTGELAGHKPVQLMAGNSFTFTEAGVEGSDRVVPRRARVWPMSFRPVRSSWSMTGLSSLPSTASRAATSIAPCKTPACSASANP